jgi:hypothetical protein
VKRAAMTVVAITLLATVGVFAAAAEGYAIGVEVAGQLPGVALGYLMSTFHFPRVPLIFALGITPFRHVLVTVDYLFTESGRQSAWYFGLGGYFATSRFTYESGPTAVGARLPIGLHGRLFGTDWELFLEVAPAVGISFAPEGFDWHLQSALGLRFWF